MIYLSASSIQDFITCSKRFQYRTTSAEDSIENQEMAVGKIVHSVVENHWNKDLSFALSVANQSLAERGIDSSGKARAKLCLENFYENNPTIIGSLGSNDLIEYKFKEKIQDDVYLVGKMDRVVTNLGIIYDWKTGSTQKRNLANDVQSIIYYKMYQRIFSQSPKVYIVYLSSNKTLAFYPKKEYIDELFNGIIPKMLLQIRAGAYYKEGYFNGGCYRCPFVEVCSRD